MAVYKRLPQTNCRECGAPTCYTFPLKLAASQKKVADCPPLYTSQYAENLRALQAMVIDAPAIGRAD